MIVSPIEKVGDQGRFRKGRAVLAGGRFPLSGASPRAYPVVDAIPTSRGPCSSCPPARQPISWSAATTASAMSLAHAGADLHPGPGRHQPHRPQGRSVQPGTRRGQLRRRAAGASAISTASTAPASTAPPRRRAGAGAQRRGARGPHASAVRRGHEPAARPAARRTERNRRRVHQEAAGPDALPDAARPTAGPDAERRRRPVRGRATPSAATCRCSIGWPWTWVRPAPTRSCAASCSTPCWRPSPPRSAPSCRWRHRSTDGSQTASPAGVRVGGRRRQASRCAASSWK